MFTSKPWKLALGMMLAMIVLGGSAYADTIETVTINTSSLTAGSYDLAFQFNDGSGTLDGNNTVTLSNFFFGSGSPSGAPLATYQGLNTDGTGNLGSSVALTDSGFFNLFVQQFTPGSTLSFLVDITGNVDAINPQNGIYTPDQFAVNIFNPQGNLIPTNDPTGNNSFYVLSIDSTGSAQAQQYAAVPEPASLALLGSGLLTCAALLRRRTKMVEANERTTAS